MVTFCLDFDHTPPPSPRVLIKTDNSYLSRHQNVQPERTGTCRYLPLPHFLSCCPPFLHQELRCREEELKRAALEQKSHEEFLRQREQQLAQWEQDVFERELSLLILHLNQNQEKPNVKKRKGTFKKHKLKGKNGEISMPQGPCE